MNNTNGNEKTGVYGAVLFIIWPFLAVFTAFRNYRENWAKNILWAFVAFYGFSFAIGAESQGSDIVRYVNEVKYLNSINLGISDAIDYYQVSGEIDIVRTFLALVVSRFTDSQAILTLVYGIIFGFFFSRNIWYLLEQLDGKLQAITLLLFTCFFLEIPFWDMNGFRMWTAAHVFIYGVLPFLFEGNRKGLWISCLSLLFHFSFLIPLALLFFYIFAGNRLTIYFLFFFTTFFISEIDLEVVNQLVENYAPEILQERTSSYRAEGQVEEHRSASEEGRVWYARWYGKALKWSVMGYLVVLYFKGKSFFMEHEGWLRLFSFILLFYGVSNILSSLPSGGRYLSIVNMMALALITMYVQNREHERVLKRFITISIPALLLFVVVAVRTGLYTVSATSILGNPILAIFLVNEHVSLNDVLRMII